MTINTLVHTDNFNDNEQPFAQSPVHQEAQINQEVSPLEHPQNLTTRVISSAKPNFTYTDLITLALKDKTSLTVSGIYQWITENFPYFKAEDDRWKNSVRHNLSMNPHFRKGTKSKQGAGHVWVLADEGKGSFIAGSNVKLISNEVEAAEAVRNILGSRSSEDRKKPRKMPGGVPQVPSHQGLLQPHPNPIFSQSIPFQQTPQPAHQFHPIQQHRIIRNGDSLQKSAEEILAGIKRPTAVEGAVVQFLVPEKQSQIGEGWKTQNIGGKRIYQNFDAFSRPVPVNNSSTTMAINLTTMPSYQVTTSHGVQPQTQNNLTFCTMEQANITNSAYTCQYLDYTNYEYSDTEGLEKALGLDFTGVVQRELSAK
eukprot:TRINITY_DN45445_c0_g1_i1.p1 TRINITY_DN45445_c0_g1~~TRINITY_DN45445_c0_g1_i1.p1  ORF type:complete len:411 (-),score=71.58 TRINITY_DN45445_c0_g1_i1:55-1158(-)